MFKFNKKDTITTALMSLLVTLKIFLTYFLVLVMLTLSMYLIAGNGLLEGFRKPFEAMQSGLEKKLGFKFFPRITFVEDLAK